MDCNSNRRVVLNKRRSISSTPIGRNWFNCDLINTYEIALNVNGTMLMSRAHMLVIALRIAAECALI